MEKVKVREQEKEGENDNKIFLKIKYLLKYIKMVKYIMEQAL